MSNVSTDPIVQRIQRTHRQILRVTSTLTGEQLARRLAPTATPPGWHLWHIARWADRLQASYPDRPVTNGRRWDLHGQLWIREKLARAWGLASDRLGVLETGAGMADDDAAAVARVGREALLDYAERAFGAADEAVVKLATSAGVERTSIQEYRVDVERQTIVETDGARVPVAADLAFHVAHANRHLGCIEALRGVLDMRGTASA